MRPSLTLRAGPDALRLLRERGLRADDVDVVPGASGGAKWLALGGVDRYLFGELLQRPRARPLHLIGSSIGSWRMACLAQRDPVAALERGHRAYIYEQRYPRRPSPRTVTEVLGRALDVLLGPSGVDEILSHPWARLHIITAQGRGLAANDRRPTLMAALALAAAGIIAPAFEPVAKLAVGLVRGSGYTVRRALIAVGAGYASLAVVGALAYLLLHGLGMASPEALAASEGVKMVTHPTAADWIVSAGGAAAGVVIISAFRRAVIAGALIALALVPGAALVGAGVVAGQMLIALEALRRVGLDVLLVVVLGGAVLFLKQHLIHHNRRPLT
jgi:hypothetical protein